LCLIPVSPLELGEAQAYLAGSFPLTIETPDDIAVQVLNAMFYELPMQEISTFRERVTAIRPIDIQRGAQQYIRPDRLTVVLVGNARGFVPKLNEVDVEVIPIGDLDLMQPTLRRSRVRAESDAPTVEQPGMPTAQSGIVLVSQTQSPRRP